MINYHNNYHYRKDLHMQEVDQNAAYANNANYTVRYCVPKKIDQEAEDIDLSVMV